MKILTVNIVENGYFSDNSDSVASGFKAPENNGFDIDDNNSANNMVLQNVLATKVVSNMTDFIVNASKKAIDYHLSGIVYETGDSNFAASVIEKYQDTMFWINALKSVGASTIAGGLTLGVPGALLGGISTAGSLVFNQLTAKAEFDREYNFNLKIDDFNVDYNRARSGTAVYGGGRLR